MDLDVITVLIVPEKKGLFLKYSEYEVNDMLRRFAVNHGEYFNHRVKTIL